MSNRTFAALVFAMAFAIVGASQFIANEYFFTAAYTVLQFVVLATAWNILGGYTGYVNFGSAAFFATGAYSSVFLYKALQASLPHADTPTIAFYCIAVTACAGSVTGRSASPCYQGEIEAPGSFIAAEIIYA